MRTDQIWNTFNPIHMKKTFFMLYDIRKVFFCVKERIAHSFFLMNIYS